MDTTRLWYIKTKSGAAGPYTFDMLRQFVEADKLPENAMLSESRNGPWIAAGSMDDLFRVDLKPSELVPDVVKQAASSAAKAAGAAANNTAMAMISATKSIAEYQRKKSEERRLQTREREKELEANRVRYFSEPDPVPELPQGNVHVHVHVQQAVNVTNVNSERAKRWDRNIAVACSLVIPGLGQMYKGQVVNGLLWLIIVVSAYAFNFILGFVVHLFCLLGASHGDEYR